MNAGERRALLHYRIRGYRLLGANVRAAGYELDLILRRGDRVIVAEVKSKAGDAFGAPLEMIDDEKIQRVSTAAWTWLAAQPDAAKLELQLEAVAVTGRRVERVPLA